MIAKIKSLFSKKEEPKKVKYINPKGKRKLTKKERKKLYDKQNRNKQQNYIEDDIIDNDKIDEWIKKQDEIQNQSTKKTKVKFSRKISSLFGSALLLMACSFSGPIKVNQDNNDKSNDSQSALIEDSSIINNSEINTNTKGSTAPANSEMDGPIAIGDKVTLHENTRYYETASMIDNGVAIEGNLYVDGDDYNVISAVAIVDENNNIRYVNYEDGYELFNVLKEIEYLGITNYNIVLHYGPLTEEQKTSDVNQYQLGWSSINNMNKVKSKKN